jgi:hypothetical protein
MKMLNLIKEFQYQYDPEEHWEDLRDDLYYKHKQLLESSAIVSTAHEDLLFKNACTTGNCLDIRELGIHDSLLEIRSSSASVIRKIDLGMDYDEAGGYILEKLTNNLAASLG